MSMSVVEMASFRSSVEGTLLRVREKPNIIRALSASLHGSPLFLWASVSHGVRKQGFPVFSDHADTQGKPN